MYSKLSLLLILTTILLLNSGYSCTNTAPQFSREEEKLKIVRKFFAQILNPEPTEEKIAIPFKTACLANPEALWLIVNDPETLNQDPIVKGLIESIKFNKAALAEKSTDDIINVLNRLPDSFYQNLNDSLQKEIQSFTFTSISALAQFKYIKIPSLGAEWTHFLQNILFGYFPALETADKKRVFASFLLNTLPNSSNTEILLSLIYASGPFFQKYMQLLGDKLETGKDPQLIALKEGLMKVKSGLPSIQPFYVNQYLKEIREAGNLNIEIEKSLGAASVGETFLAYMGNENEKTRIVIKLMRPGVEEIAEREAQFLQKEANNISKTMGKNFEGLKAQIFEEMDYTIEGSRLAEGYKVYNDSTSVIRAIRPIEGFKNSKHWLAMGFAPGKTFKDIGQKAPPVSEIFLFQARVDLLIKGMLLDLFTQKFIQKTFFLSPQGFFHGDLHEGNIMMYVNPKVYELLLNRLGLSYLEEASDIQKYSNAIKDIMNLREEGKPLIQLTLIDFSNAHTLEQEERAGMLNLFVAATNTSKSSKAFLEALNQLLDTQFIIPESNFAIYEEELSQKAFNPLRRLNPFTRLGNSIDVLMNHDVPIPSSVLAFSRSLAMIDNSYDQLIDLGFKSFNITRTFEKTTICPLVSQTVYGFTKPLAQYLIKLLGYGSEETCQQVSDIELSYANKKSIICNLSSSLCSLY